MNKKGFTLLELIITLTIIGILCAVIYGTRAEGMETSKLVVPADDATITEVIKLLKQNPHRTVTILCYAADWTMDIVDPLIKESKGVYRTMIEGGVPSNQIVWGFANKGGLSEDPMPTPVADGVYLYLK